MCNAETLKYKRKEKDAATLRKTLAPPTRGGLVHPPSPIFLDSSGM
jgi:hypothetical protein